MMLTVLKHGGKCDLLGKMFKIKGPSFEMIIVGFMKIVSHHLYDSQVKKARSVSKMQSISEFSNFSYAMPCTLLMSHSRK